MEIIRSKEWDGFWIIKISNLDVLIFLFLMVLIIGIVLGYLVSNYGLINRIKNFRNKDNVVKGEIDDA